ncbi:hypothetical protein FB007_1268 [Sinorhizobium medicae]|nr:hypothetical protein FB007_1268 [Sinorhizobium medicae]
MLAIASLLGLCFRRMLRSSFGLLEFELVCLANKIAELSEVLKIGEAVRVRRIHGAVSRSEEPVHGMPAGVEAGLRVAHRLQFLRPPARAAAADLAVGPHPLARSYWRFQRAFAEAR